MTDLDPDTHPADAKMYPDSDADPDPVMKYYTTLAKNETNIKNIKQEQEKEVEICEIIPDYKLISR